MTSQFIIRKLHSVYLVSIQGLEVAVEPIQETLNFVASKVIASSMQTISNSKLYMRPPADPSRFLQEYFKEKGWDIEEVE